MKNIVIFGPQGSGKGTQAKRISADYSIPHISTGDMLREAIGKGTELGMKAKEIINQGKLVPDEIVNGIVRERLAMDDCREGFVLDGYPRNIAQARALDSFTELNYVIVLEVSDNVSVERIVHRRLCRSCGKIFGAGSAAKEKGVCDECGGELYQRDDDKEDAIRKRLMIYHEETESLLEYYRPRNIVFTVDGEASIGDVTEALRHILG